jgi:hypothetical protein
LAARVASSFPSLPRDARSQGGNVPQFVANKKAPGIADAAIPGIEAWIKKRRA